MNIDTTITWLMALVPLSISPGPANVLFAASGSTFGAKATISFWLGSNLICILQSLAVGSGLGLVIDKYPSTAGLIKYAGVAFLLYLAYKYVRMAVLTKEVMKPLSFKDGVVIEMLNVKYLMIPMIMFSQFYSSQERGYIGLVGLTFALGALTMTSNFIWIVGGKVLTVFLSRRRVQKYQGVVFGLMLCVAAVWLTVG